MEERVYTVPIDVRNVASQKQASRAIREVREHLSKHLNVSEDRVYLDPDVNEEVWSRGRRKPPRKLKVRAQKFEDGVVEATLLEE